MEPLRDEYIKYHLDSAKIKDVDPSNDCLVYIADRFELNLEQRYWLAFLYSTCYCAPTVYYMYNEFPDYENVDVGRLTRWWKSNKHRLLFQTDRLRIKSNDHFVPSFLSYQKLLRGRSQREAFSHLKTPMKRMTWESAEKFVTSIDNVGRFTSFIYLEMVSVLTDFKCEPATIDWKSADNCRKGLAYTLGLEDSTDYVRLDKTLSQYQSIVRDYTKLHSIFNLETTLCAFKKHHHGKRYVGYYLDRQRKEIDTMTSNVRDGVHWGVLNQFRLETYGRE